MLTTLEGGITKKLFSAFYPLCYKLIVSREDWAGVHSEAKYILQSLEYFLSFKVVK